MKPLPLIFALALLWISPGSSVASDATTDLPSASGKPNWMVRVEVLMTALPQDDFLVLLPELRDPHKIDAATARILAAIGQGKAILTGYPLVQTLDGKTGLSETFLEKRFPTEFQPPQIPQTFSIPGNSYKKASPIPTACETRNTGSSVDVTPVVNETGDFIRLDLAAERVDFLAFDYVHVGCTSKWGEADIGAAIFLTTRDRTTMSVWSGAHVLIGVHPLSKPEGYVEVFILQAVATSVK